MSQRLRHVWYIGLLNIRLFLNDRLAVGMFVLFPFLFNIVFSILLANTGAADPRLDLHLVTRETGGISQHIIQSLVTIDESKLKPGDPIVIWDQSYDQDLAAVNSGKLGGFLAFPADFTQKVQSGQPTSLEVVAMPDATTIRATLDGLAQSISSSIGSQGVEVSSVVALLTQQGASQTDIQAAVAKIFQEQNPTQPLITTQAESVGEVKPINASSYVVPGFLVMFVFFAAAMSSVDIIRERRNHTLERMLATSVRKDSLLGGIYLGGVFRGLVQIIIFWTFGVLAFKVNLGYEPWAVFLLSFIAILMSAAFSLMLSTLVKSERSASALAVLVSLILAPLGGCWWPLFIDPKWMQFLAKLTPHGWANEGFNKLMLFGATGGDVMWNFLILVGFSAAFVIVAVLRFRTSE